MRAKVGFLFAATAMVLLFAASTPGLSYPFKGVTFHCATRPPYSLAPYTDADKRAVLERLKPAGVTWVRVFVQWWQAEPDGPRFDPTYKRGLDECLRLIRDSGMSVLLAVYGTPSWAQRGYEVADRRKPPSDCLSAAAPCGSFGGLVRRLTAAYPSAGAVEVWNEPNGRSYLLAVCNRRGWNWGGGCGTDVEAEKAAAHDEYSSLFRSAAAAETRIPVVLGGIASATYYRTRDWLADLYGEPDLSKDAWDVVALHPYPPYASSSDCPSVERTFAPVRDAVKIMSAHGDGAKPIWLTELGWSDLNGEAPGYCSVGEQQERASEALVDVPRDVGVEMWWLTDRKHFGSCPQGTWNCGTALLRWSGSAFVPNPVYSEFSEAP